MPHRFLHPNLAFAVARGIRVSGNHVLATHDDLAGVAVGQTQFRKSLVRYRLDCTTGLAVNDAHGAAGYRFADQQASTFTSSAAIGD